MDAGQEDAAATAGGARSGRRPWAGLPARSCAAVRSLRLALSPHLDRALSAASRVPPGAAAAGAIGIAALMLSLLAGDGDAEFPGPSFEASMLSRLPPSQAAEAGEARAPLSAALADRLVEDPAFETRPEAHLRASAGGPSGQPTASPGATALEAERSSGRDAVAVLSAAVPPPADPALRLLERLRAHSASTAAEGMPAPPPAASLAAPGRAKAAGAKAEPPLAVQLLAVARREQAADAWSRLQRDNADLLGRLQPIIVEPQRKVSTLFRLRAGPVASVNEGQALCASLARRAVDCIVVHGGG